MRIRAKTAVVAALSLFFSLPVGGPSAAPSYRVVSSEAPIDGLGAGAVAGGAVVIRAPTMFTMVGITYRGHPVDFEIRTRDSSTWSAWTHLDTETAEGPDPGSVESRSGRRATLLNWTGPAREIQVRPESPGAAISDARIHFLDATGRALGPIRRLAAWLKPGGSTAAHAAARPGIVTRAQWGADENLRSQCDSPVYNPELKGAFVHHTAHTADGNNYSPSDSPAIIRSIYYYHVKANGFCDIGYNFLVDRFGTIFEGRYGGMDRAVRGAHARGFNTGTTGIALIGNFVDASPSAAGADSLVRLIGWKFNLHRVNPRALVTYTSAGSDKYPEGTLVTLPTISGHKDVAATACPGRLYDALPEIRGRVVFEILDGSLVKGSGPAVYLIENKARRPLPSPGVLESHFRWNEIINFADTDLHLYPESSALGYRDGSLIHTPDGTVWIVSDGKRRGFTSAEAFTGLGYSWSNIKPVAWGEATLHPEGLSIASSTGPHPDGTLVKGTGDTVWWLDDLKKRPISSAGIFESRFRWEEIVNISDVELASYPLGNLIGYRDGTLIGTPDTAVWVISNGARRGFASASVFTGLGYSWSNIRPVTWEEASLHPYGDPV